MATIGTCVIIIESSLSEGDFARMEQAFQGNSGAPEIRNLAEILLRLRSMARAENEGATPIEDAPAQHHVWDGDGERCLRCGDKDWFAGPVCKGRLQAATTETEAELAATLPHHPNE